MTIASICVDFPAVQRLKFSVIAFKEARFAILDQTHDFIQLLLSNRLHLSNDTPCDAFSIWCCSKTSLIHEKVSKIDTLQELLQLVANLSNIQIVAKFVFNCLKK